MQSASIDSYPWECGAAKADVTGYVKGVGMMGYGMHFNTVEGIASRLWARAFVFRDRRTGRKFAYVCAELCFITLSVRDGVLKRLARHHPELGLRPENVMLTAQHTHSGPGGYSHYGFYNLSIPGFVPKVYQAIVEGITQAIVQAAQCLQPVRLRLAEGEFPAEAPVAFNRSIDAYNRNPDVKPLSQDERHLGVDRTMTLLHAIGTHGQTVASINWFGVHTTSISNDNHLVNADNKGYAADEAEAALGGDAILAFAQEAAGDVSPNHVWDVKKKWMRGTFEDDFESARHNGHLQAEMALGLLSQTRKGGREVPAQLECALLHADLSATRCHPAFTGGVEGLMTTQACLGISFFQGTAEGPGLPKGAGKLGQLMAAVVKAARITWYRIRHPRKAKALREMYEAQRPKAIIVEAGRRRVLGTRDVKNLIFPGFIDKSLNAFKQHHRKGGLDKKPWVPQVLPLQLVTLGNIALVAIPAEITTVAGRRLRKTMKDILGASGIVKVILCPYANAYAGYITTPEEYLEQHYEAGHTLYGRHTLPAYMTHFHRLSEALMEKSSPVEEAEPVLFTDEELAPRMNDTALPDPEPAGRTA